MHRNSRAGYVVDIPYPETFFRELSPAWLNYVAAVSGASPCELERPFTYLELGCGPGNSPITNAAAFPCGEFHACDINRSHVEQARERAAAFGILNIEFHACSFEELHPPMLDFIVAHGVYSWVSAAQRQSIRRLVRDSLKPGGLLYLSYNSLPGWAGEMPLRKLLVELAAGDTGLTSARAARALLSLERLKFLEAEPRSAAAIRAYRQAPIAYVAHEFLNDEWEAFYGVDVADQLQEAGVVYLGSATLADNHPLLLVDEATLRTVEQLETPRQRRLALDFATRRQFRRDVFCKARPPVATSALERVWVGCTIDPRLLPTQVKVPRGIVHFRETFIRKLGALLEGGPLRMTAAVTALAGNGIEAEECRRNLLYLVAAGALQPFARKGDPLSSECDCEPANAIVRQILRHSVEHEVDCVLPSAWLGNGVRVTAAEAVTLTKWLAGDRVEMAPDVVRRLLRVGILR
jgi:SAM-dependent methyltransferase